MSDSKKFDVELMKQELNNAGMIFQWTFRLFGLLGLNPMNFNKRFYWVVLVFTLLQMTMGLVNIPTSMRSRLVNIVENITELGSMCGVLMKLFVYKQQSSKLCGVVIEIMKDYSISNYKSEREVRIHIEYIDRAKTFVKFFVFFGGVAPVLYYLRIFVLYGIGVPTTTDPWTNATVYVLPYRIRFYYPLVSLEGYIFAMIYVTPMIPLTGFMMVADASLFVAMLAHLCGQLSVLSRCFLRPMADDLATFRLNAAIAIAKHNRLIKLTKDVDSAYSLLLLQQVMEITFFLCMVGYNILTNWDNRESINDTAIMAMFAAFSVSMIILLYGYCYIGQSLIDESAYLFDAVYDGCWYQLQPADMRYYVVLLNQAKQPLYVTGGGFYIYSLESFLATIKSAMAYLSVLRQAV